jgi:hypothetical protein
MRHLLLLFIFSFWNVCSNLYGQDLKITGQVPSAGIDMCGMKKEFQLQLVNEELSAISGRVLNVTSSLAGVYFHNIQSDHGGVQSSVPALTEGVPSFEISIDSLPVGDTVRISFDGQAGCNVNIGSGEVISAVIQIKEGVLPIASTTFSIRRNQNGALVRSDNPTVVASWDQFGAMGDIVVRKFRLQNTSSNAFSGFIHFLDTPRNAGMGVAFNIEQIKIVYEDSTMQLVAYDSIEALVQTIPSGQSIEVHETIQLYKCVDLAELGLSTVIIRSGCIREDFCYIENFNTQVRRSTLVPNMQIRKLPIIFERETAYHSCYAETSFQNSSIVIDNLGGAAATDLIFSFLPATFYDTDPYSFEVEIMDENDIVISQGVVELNNFMKEGDVIIYGYNRNSNQATSVDYYRDIIVDSATTYAYGGAFNFNSMKYGVCSERQEYMISRVISHYKDDADVIHSINVQAGHSMRIRWKDRHCCFEEKPDFVVNMEIAYPIIRVYQKNCSGSYPESSNVFLRTYNDAIQTILPYSTLLNGNRDKCILTKDGDVAEVNIQNNFIQIFQGGSVGKIVVDLQLDNGLDLDLTLGGYGLSADYDNTCGYGNCDNPCIEPLWPTSDKYRISFISDIRSYVWESESVALLETTASYKTYRILFDQQTLLNDIPGNSNVLPETYLNQLLGQMRLNFFVRSDCPSPPVSQVKQSIGYLPTTSCTTNCVQKAIIIKEFHFTVVCPGCEIPGGNTVSAVLQRESSVIGLQDNNNDGIPDSDTKVTQPTLLQNCANGDVLVGNITVLLSDGEAKHTVANLNAAEIYLDNLYIKMMPSISVLEPFGGYPEVSLDTINWYTIGRPVYSDGGSMIAHIKALDLSLSSFNGLVGQNIYIRLNARVKRENIYNNVDTDSKIIYINVLPYFSDCDDCINSNNDWTFKHMDDATEIVCNDWDPITTCMPRDRMFWWCSSGETMLNYIPLATTLRKNVSGIVCNPMLDLYVSVTSKAKNSFPLEYRTFYSDSVPFVMTTPIPPGYRINRLIITNENSSIYRTITTNAADTYRLETAEEILNAQSLGLLSIVDDTFRIEIKTATIPPNIVQASKNVTYTGQPIRVWDDYLYVRLQLYLEPISCGSVPFESYFGTDMAKAGYTHMSDPYAVLPELPNTDAGVYDVLNNGTISIHEPNTLLSGNPVHTTLQPQGTRFYIPLVFENSVPLDSVGGYIYKVDGSMALRSENAYYPFIKVKPNSDPDIKILGVYRGQLNNTSALGFNFYDSTSHIAFLENDNNNKFIPANARDQYYTIVAEYDCGQGCDPMLPECNTGTGSEYYPECVKNVKELFLQYGWNCTGYPQGDLDIENGCFVQDMVPIHLETLPVALTFGDTLNNNEMVSLCEPFDYTLYVQSCQLGVIRETNIEMVLPQGVRLISASVPVDTVSSLGKILFKNISGIPLNMNEDVTIKLTLQMTEALSDSLTLDALVFGTTYCNSIFSKWMSSTVAVAPLLSGFDSSDVYCLYDDPVLIIPAILGGTFSPNVTDNNDGTATMSPATLGIGIHTISYTITDTFGCTASETRRVEIFSAVPVSITNPSGAAPLLCGVGGIPLTVNPSVGDYTYQWSYTPTLNPESYTLLSTTTSTHQALQVGFYKATVTPLTLGCTSGEAVYEVVGAITVDSIEPICKGQRPRLVIRSKESGDLLQGSLNAQWYRLSDNQLLSGGIYEEGYYYGVVIARPDPLQPSCTLSTVMEPSYITIKQAPENYSIKIDGVSRGSVMYCNSVSDPLLLVVQNPEANVNYPNPLEITWGHTTMKYPLIPENVTVNKSGSYGLVVKDLLTKCSAFSNVITLIEPSVGIVASCGPNGTDVVLRAVTNYFSDSSIFTWKKVENPGVSPTVTVLSEQGKRVTVDELGVLYTVEHSFIGCASGDGYYLPDPLPFVGTSYNMVDHGDFVSLGGTDCDTNYYVNFETEYLCQSDKNADALDKIGHYMINGPEDYQGAGLWNSFWTGTARNTTSMTSGNEFMIVDGSQGNADIFWKRKFSVQNATRYFARASIRNIAIEDQFPVHEIPGVSMMLVFSGPSNRHDGFSARSIQVLHTTLRGTDPWIEFGSLGLATLKHGADIYKEIETIDSVEVILSMGGVGAIGRDIGVDDIELWPVGFCDTLAKVVPVSPCTGVSLLTPSILVCPGGDANIIVGNVNTGVTFSYRKRNQDLSYNQVVNLDAHNSFTITLPDSVDEEHYLLTVSGNGCNSTLSFMVRTVTPPELSIVAVADANTCQNNLFKVRIDGTENTNLRYEWFVNNILDTTQTGSRYTAVAPLAGGTVLASRLSNYTWCADTISPLATFTISFSTFVADAGADKSICLGDSVQIGAVVLPGKTYEWKKVSFTQPNTNPVFSLASLADVAPDTTTKYVVKVTDATSGCAVVDTVNVQVKPLPANQVGSNYNHVYCGAGRVGFSYSSGPNTVSFTYPPEIVPDGFMGPAPNVLVHYVLVPEVLRDTTLYVMAHTTSSNGCTTTRQVAFDLKPLPQFTVTPGARCGTGTVELNATVDRGDVDWYGINAGGPRLYRGDTFVTPVLTATTTYYITSSICHTFSRIPVVATVGNVIPAIGGPDPEVVCYEGTRTLTASATPGATINWYNTQVGGTVLGTGTSFTTPVLTATRPYWAESVLDGCTSSSRRMYVINVFAPVINYVVDAQRCGAGSVSLMANANLPVEWYSVPTGGTRLHISGGNSVFNTPSLTTTTTYYVQSTLDGCVTPSRTPVVATINYPPTVSNAGPDQTVCLSSTTLGANTPTSGSGHWTVISGIASVTNPFSPTSGVTGLQAGTSATLRWSISSEPCTTSSDDVVITRLAGPCKNGVDGEAKLVVEEVEFEVRVEPNPFTEQTVVTVSGVESTYVKIVLIDMSGKVVYKSDKFPVNEPTLVGEGLASGMHALRVYDGDRVITEKILKIK